MLLKSKKRLTAYVLAALCVASTGFAATEHWNDASTTPKTVVSTQAGDANWEQWKTSWESIKNDYEQVSMAPGKDATQMNFAWYSMDKAKASEIRVSTNADMSGARSFLVSPGDQINEPAEDQSAAKIKLQEQQYAGYLSAKALRSLPEATSIGNHDSMDTASHKRRASL